MMTDILMFRNEHQRKIFFWGLYSNEKYIKLENLPSWMGSVFNGLWGGLKLAKMNCFYTDLQENSMGSEIQKQQKKTGH